MAVKIWVFLFFLSAVSFSKEVLIAMALSKPPYIFEEDASGLECDIIRESFRAAGVGFKPLFVPMNRAENFYKTGKVDAVINKLENSLDGFPSDSYIDYHNVAATLKSRNLKIQTLDDLTDLRIGAFQTAKNVLGETFKDIATKNYKYAEIAKQKLQVEQLLRKRVDVIIGDTLVFKYYQKTLKEESNLTEEIEIHKLFPKTSYRIIFKNSKIRDDFNKGLKIIKKNKLYSNIINHYTAIKPINKK